MEAGSVTLQLIDEDGEDLPGTWAFEWSGRDPLELAIYAITELSGRPWKWSARVNGAMRLSPKRCRALAIRVGRVLRKDARKTAAAVIARIIANETLRPGKPAPDPTAIGAVLGGTREVDWDAGPTETTPAMIRALRTALRSAVDNEAGLAVQWGAAE